MRAHGGGWSDRLVAAGIVSRAELAAAERVGKSRGLTLSEAIVALGTVSEDQVSAAIAEELGVELVFPYAAGVEPRLVARFPLAVLHRLGALPLHEDEGRVVAALARPGDAAAVSELSRICGAPIQVVMAPPQRIHRALDELSSRMHVSDKDEPAEVQPAHSDPAAITLLFQHLALALRRGASELRFDPVGHALSVRIRDRASGLLEEVARARREGLLALVARVRTLAGLAPAGAPRDEGSPPGDDQTARRLRTEIGGRPVDIRMSILAVRDGESVRIGLGFPPRPRERLDDLGLPAETRVALEAAISSRRGLVVILGEEYEAASFAYTALRALDPARTSIVTLEEARLESEPRFCQVEPARSAPLESRLGACLAHAPDALYVGGPVEPPAFAALVRAAGRRLVLVRLDPLGPVPALPAGALSVELPRSCGTRP